MRFVGLFALISCVLASPVGATQQVKYSGSFGGSLTFPSTSTTTYTSLLDYPHALFATAENHPSLISTSGTLLNFRLETDVAPGSGTNYTFTVMKNSIATSLACTISDTNTSCTDISNTVSVVGGDLVTLRIVPTGSVATIYPRWVVTFNSTTANESIYVSGSQGGIGSGTGSDKFFPIQGWVGNGGATSDEFAEITPIAGTVKNLYVRLSHAPGSGGSRALTLYVNGSPTTLTCTITHPSTTCNDTVNTVAVSTNDLLAIFQDETSTTVSPRLQLGLTVVASTPTWSMFVVPADFLPNSFTNYYVPIGASDTGSTTETLRIALGGSSQLTGLTAYLLDGDPENGDGTQSFTFTLRKNQQDTALTCTISETATSCSIGAAVDIQNDDDLTLAITPASTTAPSFLADGNLHATISFPGRLTAVSRRVLRTYY